NIARALPRPVNFRCLPDNTFPRNGTIVSAIKAIHCVVTDDEVTTSGHNIIVIAARKNIQRHCKIQTCEDLGVLHWLSIDYQLAVYDSEGFARQGRDTLQVKLSLGYSPTLPFLRTEDNYVSTLWLLETISRSLSQQMIPRR